MSLVHSELFEGFSKLSLQERFNRLVEMGALTQDDINYFKNGGINDVSLAEKCIENALGYFQLPLGVATYFRMNHKDYIIPMAVEETSIVAALSKTAKWVRQKGAITAQVEGHCILGQIQLPDVKNPFRCKALIEEHQQSLIASANRDVADTMVKRGGGVTELTVRDIKRPDGKTMIVIHVMMNCCDAMGANILNQVLEFLKTPIETLTEESVGMCILSNLNVHKLTTTSIIVNDVPEDLGNRLQEASLFAEIDPYRAATSNKGVMNGMDAVLIATGNDWRAVEASVHAYASRNGHYQSITTWRYENNTLYGTLTAPVIVGTVGGVTSLHPTAKRCLSMMQIGSANELSSVVASVGLLQNLGAIRALCTEGIIQGHMKLHIDNFAIAAGAKPEELPMLKAQLTEKLYRDGRISLQATHDVLSKIRAG